MGEVKGCPLTSDGTSSEELTQYDRGKMETSKVTRCSSTAPVAVTYRRKGTLVVFWSLEILVYYVGRSKSPDQGIHNLAPKL
jgi:hypothetical protein